MIVSMEMEQESIDGLIEAVLFFKGEPVSLAELAKTTHMTLTEIESAVGVLSTRLSGGIRLMRQDDMVMLATAPEYAVHIESLIKEELSKDLGKAGAETLAVVLYMGPVTRARIDHIRGVNSTFILRNLAARGLVEKMPHPTDSRSMLYRPTLALLAHLGVSDATQLPEYRTIRDEIGVFEQRAASHIQNDSEESQHTLTDDEGHGDNDVLDMQSDMYDDE
ncbi:MAG: SMC-Scp complex subunit ScpB [Candidatus Yonathbacteria bacterium]|nr:SMC-Scp complex subunit ScpB [Candidatus Yonathbacteria bacterium]NTW47874.1 SMC-Scp complex subunit ScpB [Candidatus Yonathbacteria bacterium]